MKKHSHQAFSERLAMGLSIGLHSLLLLLGYYVTISRHVEISTNYSIALTSISSQHPVKTKASQTLPPKKRQVPKTPPQTPSKLKPTTTNTPQRLPQESIHDNNQQPVEKPALAEQEAKPVDERGLYQAQPGKQAGVKLDLAGWMWDNAPQPPDDTDETGKIVFEIKIDELGEVIAVKTLEKTVSPLVEKIYKDTLTELTFSRTMDNIAYSPVYVGKVTFILRAK